MSTVIAFDSKEMCNSILMLSSMFPRGSMEMPVGLQLADGYLTVSCFQGCAYTNRFPVHSNEVFSVTILYHDISALITQSTDLTLIYDMVGVTIKGPDFDAHFSIGYSTVKPQLVDQMLFHDIQGSQYADTLRTLWSLNLEKLYNIASPIVIKHNVALQRYPNTWVQVKALGLPFTAVLDVEHVKLVVKFKANAVSTDTSGMLVFKNRTAYLHVPCRVDNNNVSVADLMHGLGEPHKLVLGNYVDKVRQASRIDPKSSAKIVLYDGGLKTEIVTGQTTISIANGSTEGTPLLVCNYPMPLWLALLKSLGDGVVQFLVGGDKLCMRTGTIVILTRVLL